MEEKRGGKREGAGRKPTGVAKETVSLFVEKGKIYKFGSKDNLKTKLYEFISTYGMQDLNKPTNEIKPFEQPKTNYFVDTTPKPVKRPKSVQEWISEKREIIDPEIYQVWFKELNADPYLSQKEKSIIKSA